MKIIVTGSFRIIRKPLTRGVSKNGLSVVIITAKQTVEQCAENLVKGVTSQKDGVKRQFFKEDEIPW